MVLIILYNLLIFRNLDPLTETYGLSFYMQYLAHWPEYFQVAESPSGEIMGYSKSSMQNWFNPFFISKFVFSCFLSLLLGCY